MRWRKLICRHQHQWRTQLQAQMMSHMYIMINISKNFTLAIFCASWPHLTRLRLCNDLRPSADVSAILDPASITLFPSLHRLEIPIQLSLSLLLPSQHHTCRIPALRTLELDGETNLNPHQLNHLHDIIPITTTLSLPSSHVITRLPQLSVVGQDSDVIPWLQAMPSFIPHSVPSQALNGDNRTCDQTRNSLWVWICLSCWIKLYLM